MTCVCRNGFERSHCAYEREGVCFRVSTAKTRVLWVGPGHRCATCVEVPEAWLAAYRARVVGEWRGTVLGVYRVKS